jgi:hypothetical protein
LPAFIISKPLQASQLAFITPRVTTFYHNLPGSASNAAGPGPSKVVFFPGGFEVAGDEQGGEQTQEAEKTITRPCQIIIPRKIHHLRTLPKSPFFALDPMLFI